MSLRTPLGKARGLGSAGEGVEHWWQERLAAIALVPLVIWFVYSIVRLGTSDPAAIDTWLSSPLNAILMTSFLLAALFHSNLGLRVIVEDYVHAKALKLFTLTVLALLHVLLAICGIYAVLKFAFGA